MQEFSMVGGYTEDLKKQHKTVKIGVWALTWGKVLAQDNTVFSIHRFATLCSYKFY